MSKIDDDAQMEYLRQWRAKKEYKQRMRELTLICIKFAWKAFIKYLGIGVRGD